MSIQDKTIPGVVIINDSNGHTVIENDSELKRLNYFDGKFLRAPDMKLEQNALLNQIRISNQASGSGVIHGFSCLLQGNDSFKLTQGLAIDHQGRVLQLGNEVDVSIADLIARASSSDSMNNCDCQDGDFTDCEKVTESGEADTILQAETLYLIVLHYVEAYCGEEDVYGKLCESACVGSTQRPYILPGIEIRAIPLTLQDLKQSPLISGKHLRSRVASAYFEMERKQISSLISKQGLSSGIWCMGAEAAGGNGIPVAIIGRAASKTLFLDAWSARRERMASPPRHYWAGRLAMRSWNIFLAQVLQFQCQLTHCISHAANPDDDPCADERAVAAKVAEDMKQLMKQFEQAAQNIEKTIAEPIQHISQISINKIRDSYQLLSEVMKPEFKLQTRWLIDCGIVELPSAGYLPVDNLSAISVNDQVQRMMGEGVDLRFCVVRPDYIPHALEEAQHMERICLLEGIEDSAARPGVDVLVPDGRFESYEPIIAGTGYEMEISGPPDKSVSELPMNLNIMNARAMYREEMSTKSTGYTTAPQYIRQVLTSTDKQTGLDLSQTSLQGAARGEDLDSGGYAFYFAGRMPPLVRGLVKVLAEPIVMQKYQRQSVSEADRAKMAEYLKKLDVSHFSEQPNAEIGKAEQPEDVNKRADMWMSLRCDHDPFTLARGASCSVNLELTFMIEARLQENDVSLILEFNQQGGLTINEILASPPESNLRANLSTNGVLNTTMVINGQLQQNPISVRVNEQVYLKRSAGSELGFTISIPSLSYFNRFDNNRMDLDIGLSFEREWISATEARFKAAASFSVEVETGEQDNATAETIATQVNQSTKMTSQHRVVELLRGRQYVNPDVLKADHILHGTSLVALTEIGQALADDSYADSRSRLLFPPPLPKPDQLRIFAGNDWVMFHRRRDIQCGYQSIDEVVSKPRRYRLLLVDSLTSKEELINYVNALQNNQGDILLQVGFKEAGIVEFEPGLQTIITSHSGLRADWDTLVESDNAKLMFGAIASKGGAYDEGITLAKLRLQRTSDLLSPVTPLDEEAKLANINQLPDVLADAESDGVIIMVVAAQQASVTVCHEVYGVAMNDQGIENLRKMLQSDANATLQQLNVGKLQNNAMFNDGTTTLLPGSREQLIDDWKLLSENMPYSSILVVQMEPATGGLPNDQPYKEQTLQIISTIAGSENQVDLDIVTVENLQSDCIAVSILIVNPELIAVAPTHNYVMMAESQVADSTLAETAINTISREISFDDSGALIKDEALLKAVAEMKEEAVMIKSIEMVKEEATLVDAKEKAKAQSLLAMLKEEGLAKASAKVKMRKPSNDEKLLMMDLNRKIGGGFVLKK